ncbi:MAG: glycosyltransferase [Lachnospiraceae bacterium]|jgi:glycosyltransferase involved in cell wall biosynthesis|nr:glycosyltransferase [Lachnospiraceae bacterium]
MPEISIIMSTYNEPLEYLSASIDSVLRQTFQDYEFIIILDNPENRQIHDCVCSYAQKDKRIVVLENKQNLGLTKSLNKAIKMARGNYMSRMDADDIMAKTCLERELEAIRKDHLDFVSASKINIDEDGKRLGTYINDLSPRQMRKLLPYDNSINHPTVMVKMEIIRQENGYREIPSCEDYDLWLRILFHGFRMRILPDIFLLYRMRKDGVCGSNSYKQYLSKRFLLEMCKQARKNPDIFQDCHAYDRFIRQQNTSPEKTERFNQAYKQLYQGLNDIGHQRFCKGMSQIFLAVCTDMDIGRIILNKLQYQIRKKLVVKFVI